MRMRTTLPLIAFSLACAFPATGEEPGSAASAAASKDWPDQWKSCTDRLLEAAEAMPEEKYGYRPTSDVDTFGDQLKHAALAMKILLANAEGKTVSPKDTGVEQLKTKAEIIALVRKVVTEGAAVIGRVAGKNDAQVVQSQFFGKTTRRFLLIQAIGHNNNHYGQLVFYLRLNGIVPPASRH
ncbi:MAG TPA: DinB family protein [Polyangia bacterium]|nr:DinB family protein [Polyangia bacterium]